MTASTKKSFLIVLFSIFAISMILHIRHYRDYQTTLLHGVYIKDGQSDLASAHWSVPVVYDWDSDGKKDLLVGHNYIDRDRVNHGYVSFYKNIGTDSAPVFNGSAYLQSCAKECSALNAAAFG